jgi:hypothetical protein
VNPKRKLVILLVVAACVLAAGAIYALAESTTVYYGCVTKTTGVLRIVGANNTCKSNEYVISWNQVPRGRKVQQARKARRVLPVLMVRLDLLALLAPMVRLVLPVLLDPLVPKARPALLS